MNVEDRALLSEAADALTAAMNAPLCPVCGFCHANPERDHAEPAAHRSLMRLAAERDCYPRS